MTKLIRYISFTILAARIAQATPVMQTTAIMSKPDISSAALGVVTAGTEPEPASPGETAPEGWMAVKVTGPIDLYIENADLTKSLNPKVGSALRLEPKEEAPVAFLATANDPISITGLRGKWTRVKLSRDVVGYIQTSNPSLTQAPQTGMPLVDKPVPVSTSPGKEADASSIDSKTIQPRYFEGKMVSTHSTFGLRKSIFAWEIQDSMGERVAYLDLEKIMQTEQIDSYVDHQIQVYGLPRLEVGTHSIVVSVESLRLK